MDLKKKGLQHIQRVFSLLIIVILIYAGLPIRSNFSYGETVPAYNANQAVAYAKAHYDDFKDIPEEKGGDCTQFLRECLEAGGVPKDDARTYGYTEEEYISYLVHNGYAEKHELKTAKQDWENPQWYVKASDNRNTFAVGDGIVYSCSHCKAIFHMAINTGVDQDGFVHYHAQNKAVGDEPLCLIDCSECGAGREQVKLYALHLTSTGNGYDTAYNNKSVTGLEARRVNNTDISIKWNAVSGAAGYKVFLKNGKDSVYSLYADMKGTSLMFKEPKPDMGYYFAVRPYFVKDGKTYVGKLSDMVTNNDYLLAPTGLKASVNAEYNIRLSWDKTAGASKYDIYKSTGANGTYTKINTTDITGTTYNTSKNILPGTTYYFKVKAINKDNPAGNSPYSSVVSVKTPGMEKPVLTTSIDKNQGKIKLSWTAVKGATKYQVYRSGYRDGTYTKLYENTGTTFNTANFTAGCTYFYKIKAVGETQTAESEVVKQIAPLAKPVAKSGLSAAGKPTLSWNAVKGADEYEIYRATAEKGVYTKMHTTEYTTYTNTSASEGKTYYYKVKAVSHADADAASESAVVKKACPVKVAGLAVASGVSQDGKPRLSWEKVAGASGYEIYRAGSSTGTYKKMYAAKGTIYTNTSASGGYTYFYKIKAVSGTKVIAESGVVKQLCHLGKPVIKKGNNGDGKPMLTWNKVSGASKYEIYRSGYRDGTYTKMYTTTKTSYANTSAGTGYTYYYKVVAVSANNKGANATSEIVSQKCLSSGLKVTNGNSTAGKPKLTWNKVDGISEYVVYRSSYRNGTYTKMLATKGTSYTNTSAKKGCTYYYKVTAIGKEKFLESKVISVKCK